MRLTCWPTHWAVDLMEVIESARAEIGIAGGAVFAAATGGIHGVLEIDQDFKAMVLEAGDSVPGHAEIFVGRGFEGALHVEEARFDHHHGGGNALLVADHEVDVGPVLHFRAGRAGPAEKRQFHRSGVDAVERGREIGHELVGTGEPDLGVVHAEADHALQQRDGVGHGDLEVGLLHAVAKTGIEKFNASGCCVVHGFLP